MALRFFTALAFTVVLGITQTKPQPFTFDVISVKPNHSTERATVRADFVGPRFSAVNIPLLFLVADAYHVSFQSPRVVGLPDWAGERFDIDAKASDEVLPATLTTSQRKERTRALLQSLLEDRFKMVVHHDSKDMAFYALTVAKGGPKMQAATIDEKSCVEDPKGEDIPCHRFNGGQGRGLHGKAVNMQDLVEFVENWTDRPVLDKTSLQGLFSIETEGWVPMRQPQAPPPPPGTSPAPATATVGPPSGEGNMLDPTRPTLFMVLQKLGLELKVQKGAVDIFVVDHIERPAAN
jgi:uncharacterized protein (TIGR03435 family)